MYLFFIRRIFFFRVVFFAGCVGSVGEDVITILGVMVLVGVVRIWYVCIFLEVVEKNSGYGVRYLSSVWFGKIICVYY